MLAVSVLVYTCISIFAGPITGIFNSGNNGLLQSIAEQGLKFILRRFRLWVLI